VIDKNIFTLYNNGLFQNRTTPATVVAVFLTPPLPLSPGLSEAQDYPSCLDFQDKRGLETNHISIKTDILW